MGCELSFNGVFAREKCTKICEVLTPEFRWSSLSYFTVEYSWSTADSRNQFVWYRMWELSGIRNVSARFLSWCSWWALDTVTKRFEFPLESDAPTLRISGRVIRHLVFWRSTYWFVMFICLKEVFRKRCKLIDWCTLDLRSTVLRLKFKSGLAAADYITPSFHYYYLGKTSAGVKHLEKSSELIRSLFVYCYCIIDFDNYIHHNLIAFVFSSLDHSRLVATSYTPRRLLIWKTKIRNHLHRTISILNCSWVWSGKRS